MMRRGPLAGALALAVLLAACGGGAGPEEGTPQPPPPPPDLTGARVMLLPVQLPTPAGLDSAVTAELLQRVPRTDWVLRPELQSALDRTPTWRVRLDALPPGIGSFGKDRFVTDPLHGHLRRLGALVDAGIALLPYAATEVTDSAGTSIQISAVLAEVGVGRVLWMGTVRGEPLRPGAGPGGAGDPVARAAEALARALVP